MAETTEVKDIAFAWVGAFADYPQAKDKWHKENPKARIKEELKTMFLGQVDVPDIMNFGSTRKENCLMIIWAIIYRQ